MRFGGIQTIGLTPQFHGHPWFLPQPFYAFHHLVQTLLPLTWNNTSVDNFTLFFSFVLNQISKWTAVTHFL